jgi:hypothetical protein
MKKQERGNTGVPHKGQDFHDTPVKGGRGKESKLGLVVVFVLVKIAQLFRARRPNQRRDGVAEGLRACKRLAQGAHLIERRLHIGGAFE